MKGEARKVRKRSYRPKVEALEALRLLDASAPTIALPAADLSVVAGGSAPIESSSGHDAWDAALSEARLADFLTTTDQTSASLVNPDAVASGLSQLDRYLNRTWYRAGVPAQAHDDSTQAVYTILLQQWGRGPFDQMLADVGTFGVREVFSRDTPDGPDFFRAIDTVKKRTQREKNFQSLDAGANIAAAGTDGAAEAWRGALQEAISKNLNAREAALIQATIQGQTPAEIAQQWGVAPKTVSNEKTRAIQKLREALVADLSD